MHFKSLEMSCIYRFEITELKKNCERNSPLSSLSAFGLILMKAKYGKRNILFGLFLITLSDSILE